MPKQAVIETEEPDETLSPHPIVDESPAHPGMKNGPERGVIRTEDQARHPRGVIQAEDQTRQPQNSQTANMLQRKVGNTRAGQMMKASKQRKKPIDLPGDKDKPKKPVKPDPPKPITTPLPQGTVRRKSGVAEVIQGRVKITLVPDIQSSKKLIVNGAERDAVTRPELSWGIPKSYGIDDEKITDVEPVPPVTMTIQTTYGPGVKAMDKSAFGRGTTAEDVKTGKTTLGHHEGSHGQDALQYIKDHLLPQFAGKVGMTVEEYKQAEKDYLNDMQRYKEDMAEISKKQTDCVGTPGEGCEE